MPVDEVCVCSTTAIFDLSQFQHDLSLASLDPQERKQGAYGLSSNLARRLPGMDCLAPISSSRRDADCSPEKFLEEGDGFCLHLAAGNQLLVGGGDPRVSMRACAIYVDGNGSVTVNNASEISEVYVFHTNIVVCATTRCN